MGTRDSCRCRDGGLCTCCRAGGGGGGGGGCGGGGGGGGGGPTASSLTVPVARSLQLQMDAAAPPFISAAGAAGGARLPVGPGGPAAGGAAK